MGSGSRLEFRGSFTVDSASKSRLRRPWARGQRPPVTASRRLSFEIENSLHRRRRSWRPPARSHCIAHPRRSSRNDTANTWPARTSGGARCLVRDASGNGVSGATVTLQRRGRDVQRIASRRRRLQCERCGGCANAGKRFAYSNALGSALSSLTNTGGTSGGGTPQAPAGEVLRCQAATNVVPSRHPASTTMNTGFSCYRQW